MFSPAISKLLDDAVSCRLQPDWWERFQVWEKEASSKPPAPATQAPKQAPAQLSSTQQPQGVVAAITQACAAADCLCARLTKLCVAPWMLSVRCAHCIQQLWRVTAVTTQVWAATDRLCMYQDRSQLTGVCVDAMSATSGRLPSMRLCSSTTAISRKGSRLPPR